MDTLKRGFSLLELLITIAILSVVVVAITTAFSQLNQGINEQVAKQDQQDQFYGIKQLLEVDFGYHNLGVQSPTSICYLSFDNTHTPSWQSSCVNSHDDAIFTQTSSAAMTCSKIPGSTNGGFRKVAYFYDNTNKNVCRYQWLTEQCDGMPSTSLTGSNSLTDNFSSAQCTEPFLTDVTSAQYTYLTGASTQVQYTFNKGLGATSGTDIADSYTVIVQPRSVPDNLPIISMAYEQLTLVDNSSISVTALLTNPHTDDLIITIDPGSLTCIAPCSVTIPAGTLYGNLSLSDPSGADSLTVSDTSNISLIPNNQYLLGAINSTTIEVRASGDANQPYVRLSASKNHMVPNGDNITVTAYLSSVLSNAQNITVDIDGFNCGMNNDYVISGNATVTDCMAGSDTKVTLSIAANTLSQTFMLTPKSFTVNSTPLTFKIEQASNTEIDSTPVIIEPYLTSSLPTLTLLTPDSTIFTPHDSEVNGIKSSHHAMQLSLSEVITSDLNIVVTATSNPIGDLSCGTDYRFTGINCGDNVTLLQGQRSLTVPIEFIYHSDNNHNNTITFTLADNANVQLSTESITGKAVTYTVKELSSVGFTDSNNTNINSTNDANIPITFSPALSQATTLLFTATNNDGHYTIPNTLVAPAGATSISLVVTPTNIDNVADTTTISISALYGKGFLGPINTKTVIIN